jgi:hypothetical protein
MRILDLKGKELKESEVDLEKGKLQEDKILLKHHEAVASKPQKFHYEVVVFHFEDDTEFRPEYKDGKSDYVKVIDDQNGVFEFIDKDKTGKEVKGVELRFVLDEEGVQRHDEYDEYEKIMRYIPFTKQELEQFAAEKQKALDRQDFAENGYLKLRDLENKLDNLQKEFKESQIFYMNKISELNETIAKYLSKDKA